MEFNGWGIAFIIALALGVIISNLMLLKHSTKMKWPTREELVDPVAKAKKEREAQKNRSSSEP